MGIHRCGSNEVLVIRGCGIVRQKHVHSGSWALVLPGQQLQRLPLDAIQVTIETKDVATQTGVPVSVTTVAQVRVRDQNIELLIEASELYQGKSLEDVNNFILSIMAKCQTDVIANFTLEELYRDKEKFVQTVKEEVATELINHGLGVVSLSLDNLTNSQGYSQAMNNDKVEQGKEGVTETAEEKMKEKSLEEIKLAVESEALEAEEAMRMADERQAENGNGKDLTDKLIETQKQVVEGKGDGS